MTTENALDSVVVETPEVPAEKVAVAPEAPVEETAEAPVAEEETPVAAAPEPKVAEEPAAQEPEPAVEPEAEAEEAPAAEPVNLADKTLAQLSDIFKNLMDSADKMARSKEADAIKSAFYRLLNKIKAEGAEAEDARVLVEENFKSLYNDYKRERAEFNAQQEKERE